MAVKPDPTGAVTGNRRLALRPSVVAGIRVGEVEMADMMEIGEDGRVAEGPPVQI